MKKRFFYVAILSLLSLVSFGQGGFTPIPKLKITTTPETNNSTTEVLVRDATTGNVGKVAKSSLGGTLDSVTDAGANTTNAISTGGVGINTTTPQALFDVVSTSSGILIPRLTTSQRDAIASPSTSELIYNSTNGRFEFFNGIDWTFIGGATPNLTQVLTSGNEVEDIPIRLILDEFISEYHYEYTQHIKEEILGQKYSELNYQRLSFINSETTESASYDVGKITHNEIDYLLPSGDTSTIATLKDLENGYIPLSGTTAGNEVTGIVDFKDVNGDVTVKITQGDGDENGRIDIFGNATSGTSNFSSWGLGSFFGSQDNGATQYQFQLSSDKGISNNVDVSATIEDLDYTQKIYVDNQRGKLISLTETEILAIGTPEVGRLYYNTTQNHVVFYDGTGWKKLTHTNM